MVSKQEKILLTLMFIVYTVLVTFVSIGAYNMLPIGMWEGQEVHTVEVAWERDPAFVASMFKLQHDSMWTEIVGLTMRGAGSTTIIQTVPENKRELQTFGHECLHAFGYSHD